MLGRDEVNRGLELGVASMQKGEVAKFKLSPDYGAEGVLTFEVHLFEWVSPLEPGILKRTTRESTAAKAAADSAVEVRLFEEVFHLELPLSERLRGIPPESLQTVLLSMALGEQAMVRLEPPRSGKENETLALDLELLKVFREENCSHFKAFKALGGENFPEIMMKTLKQGAGDKPTCLSTVTARVDGRELTWRLMMEGSEPVECALLCMSKGARCRVRMGSSEHLVELLDFERMPDPWSLTQWQKLQNAELLKQQAAAFMKAQEFRRACTLRLGRAFMFRLCISASFHGGTGRFKTISATSTTGPRTSRGFGSKLVPGGAE